MSAPQTCAACGLEGWAVSTRIVEREPTPDDPTLYRAEPRCIDARACHDRAGSELDDMPVEPDDEP